MIILETVGSNAVIKPTLIVIYRNIEIITWK